VNDSEWVLSGLAVRFLEPDALPKGLVGGTLKPGRTFLRHFDAADYEPALALTTQTGALSDVSACALGDAVMQLGAPGGFLDSTGLSVASLREAFIAVATRALGGDAALAQRLFDGGVLDRRGTGRYFLGALPVRIVARHVTRESLAAARATLTGGWDADLLHVLESAGLRTTSEDLLVLVPVWERLLTETLSAPNAAPSLLHTRLREAMGSGATDVVITDEADAMAREWLSAPQLTELNATRLLVTSFTLGDVGRVRLTATIERGQVRLTLRFGGTERPSLNRFAPGARDALMQPQRGLLVLTGAPASGRSTTFAAVMQHFAQAGRACVTLEQPAFFSLLGVRQVELDLDQSLGVFRQSTRLLPVDVIGFDVLDDEAGVDAALDAAADGRLAVVVMRSLSAAAAVHRLAELDSRWHRRRLSEHLALVFCQRRADVEWLVPTESLRRHLRSQATPAPPALLELS
jgi:hypothetical protein